ncbi:MAG TPA: hypothetical protein VKB56_05360 [Terriglobales bacterium]|nr:hypothetical protein [Terriglobales bacterium]
MAAHSQPAGGAHLRRSERVPHRAALLISGTDRGVPFVSDAETVTVNQYGACVRTAYPLKLGMKVRIRIRDTRRERCARIVCLSILSNAEFGVELESSTDFWGVATPTIRIEEKLPRVPNQQEDTARAMKVVVSGISAICMPFKEQSVLLPLTATTAVMRLGPLVKPGELVRLLIGSSAVAQVARVTGVKKDRKSGGWRLWVEYCK